jgi:hypothetical protein
MAGGKAVVITKQVTCKRVNRVHRDEFFDGSENTTLKQIHASKNKNPLKQWLCIIPATGKYLAHL